MDNARSAGAIAAVVYNDVSTAHRAHAGGPVGPAGGDDSKIRGRATGGIRLSQRYTRSLSSRRSAVSPPLLPDEITSFSSRGPDASFGLKPDLVAPGQKHRGRHEAVVASAGLRLCACRNELFIPDSGRRCGPHQAVEPGPWPHLAQVAPHDLGRPGATWGGEPARVIDTGSGRLNLARAAALRTVVEPAAVSFGVTTRTWTVTPNRRSGAELLGRPRFSITSRSLSARFILGPAWCSPRAP